MLSRDIPADRSEAGLAGAFAAVERLSETAVDDLRTMVAVDTSFPPGAGYDAFADLICPSSNDAITHMQSYLLYD
jgi:succinyl-diaminopimelate desuccinylase